MGMICGLFIVSPRAARRLAAEPAGVHDLLASLDGSDAVLSLGKSWHGLHFALMGTAWAGRPPPNVLAGRGVPVGDADGGYGPARLLDPAGVAALAAADIYPQIWDEPPADLRAAYGGYLRAMRDHVRRAAAAGHALLVAIR